MKRFLKGAAVLVVYFFASEIILPFSGIEGKDATVRSIWFAVGGASAVWFT